MGKIYIFDTKEGTHCYKLNEDMCKLLETGLRLQKSGILSNALLQKLARLSEEILATTNNLLELHKDDTEEK